MESRHLVVSIHDVTPPHREELKRIFDLLEDAGVHPMSILVVPRYRSIYDLRDYPDFVDILLSLQRRGHEIVLHGLTHVRPGRSYPSTGDLLLGEAYAAGGGEFQNLTVDQASERFHDGMRIFKETGLESVGFVPPAWLMSREATEAVRKGGARYITDTWGLLDLERGFYRSEVLGFTPRPLLDHGARLYAGVISSTVLRFRGLARIAVHPQDL